VVLEHMDIKRFTDKKTGDLRKFNSTQTGRDEWLFIPREFPPDWDFPSRLWPLLADAKEALGTLNGIGQTLPSADLLLSPLQNKEAITSSRIEGIYVTPQQLLLYDLDPREPSSAKGKQADWHEVSNYRAALIEGCQMLRDAPLTNQVIRAMHRTLLSGVRGHHQTPGEFRRMQVQIGANGRYVPPPAIEVPRLMSNLERYINERDPRFDPLVQSYLVHYQLEAIHPFRDGNGRIGRVLLALMVYKLMQHSKPWLYMSEFFESFKDEYTDCLLAISTHGDWERWIELCLRGTIARASDSIRRCGKILALRDRYHGLIDPVATPRSHKIVNQLFESPVVTIPSVQKRCEITYHTAKDDIERLVRVGVLHEIESERPRSFVASELFQIAYLDGGDDIETGEGVIR